MIVYLFNFSLHSCRTRKTYAKKNPQISCVLLIPALYLHKAIILMYYEKLDGLRFVAIFLVLLEHFAIFVGRPIFAGFYGVDLFFVISGFLVTSVLFKSDKSFKSNYINFLGRRTLRIFPLYYLTILLLLLLDLPTVRENFGSLVTYTFNYQLVNKNLPPTPVSPFWSLCIEEQFYLLWPFIILLLKNRIRLLLLLTIAIVLIGYSQTVFNIFPSLSPYNYFGIVTRMASLGLGAFGALLAQYDKLPDTLLKNKYVEYFVLLLLPVSLIINFKLKMPVLGACSLYLVLKCSFDSFSTKSVESFLMNKKTIYIGTISYGIYILHMPLCYYLNTYLFDPIWNNLNFSALGKWKAIQWHSWIIKFPLYSFLSIMLAALSFAYIERPFLKLKAKFSYA